MPPQPEGIPVHSRASICNSTGGNRRCFEGENAPGRWPIHRSLPNCPTIGGVKRQESSSFCRTQYPSAWTARSCALCKRSLTVAAPNRNGAATGSERLYGIGSGLEPTSEEVIKSAGSCGLGARNPSASGPSWFPSSRLSRSHLCRQALRAARHESSSNPGHPPGPYPRSPAGPRTPHR